MLGKNMAKQGKKQQKVSNVVTEDKIVSNEEIEQAVDLLEKERATEEDALAAARKRIDELDDLYKRSLADAENIRKRAKQDIINAQKYAVERWAAELIEVKDNLERALDVSEDVDVQTLRTGVELTLKQLQNSFIKVDLVDITPEKGSAFDPHKQEAMAIVPSELPINQIVDVLRKGYQIGDRVLRAAQVVISKGTNT
jgi:molecular chaperone GrpE